MLCGIIDLSFIYKSECRFYSAQSENFLSNAGKVHFEGLVNVLICNRDNNNLGLIFHEKI